ncbi:hypothetical protein EJ08DRAFT_37046 [Tothia fuscella]|uniref:Uncharacterized protein n=1 Tax=Tothia fuscella TaxID=1048955 RepID=A0A9P4NYG5_9PEZI|nr:hypothetical protein EJ08DRAFT_37046 [Tothia fuscella]
MTHQSEERDPQESSDLKQHKRKRAIHHGQVQLAPLPLPPPPMPGYGEVPQDQQVYPVVTPPSVEAKRIKANEQLKAEAKQRRANERFKAEVQALHETRTERFKALVEAADARWGSNQTAQKDTSQEQAPQQSQIAPRRTQYWDPVRAAVEHNKLDPPTYDSLGFSTTDLAPSTPATSNDNILGFSTTDPAPSTPATSCDNVLDSGREAHPTGRARRRSSNLSKD